MRKVFLIAASLVFGIGLMMAQPLAADHPQPVQGQDRIAQQVRHELVMLPYYSVFDNLQYQVVGSSVTLSGQVTQPMVKSDAQNVVKRVPGVTSVTNDIEVLPLSHMDNRIRWAVFRSIYGVNSPLFRYGVGSQFPIRIIVKGGHVTLTGVVNTRNDMTIAMMKARQVPGTFSVTNDLQVRG